MQISIAGVPRSQVVPALIAGVMDLPPASVAIKSTHMGLQDTHMIPCPPVGLMLAVGTVANDQTAC